MLLLVCRGIRIIPLSKYNVHTDPIYINLNLDDIYKLQQLKLYFKLINKLLPNYFNHIPYTHNYEIHQYSTRGRNNLFIPRTTHEFVTKYIRHNIIQIVNNTPNIIIEIFFTQSLYGFSTYIKHYFIRNYKSCCLIPNYYICKSLI